MKESNLYFKMFWHNFKITFKKPLIIIIAGQIILSSLIISVLFLLLLNNQSRGENNSIELALNILAIKNFIQVILFGIFQIVLVIELFHYQILNKKINLEMRSGKSQINIFLEKIILIILLSLILFFIIFAIDLSIFYWSSYNSIYFHNLFSYLFYFYVILLISVVAILSTMLFKYINALIISMTLTVIIGFSQISGFTYAFLGSDNKLEFSEKSKKANIEISLAWDYFNILKNTSEFDSYFDYFSEVFKNDEKDLNDIFSMQKLDSNYPEMIQNINKTFKSDQKFIWNSDNKSSALPFNNNRYFNYNNYLEQDFKKSFNFLVENYQGSESELRLLIFINERIEELEKVLLFNNQNDLIFIRSSFYKEYYFDSDLWEYFNNNYGAVFATWLILNLTNNIFNISENLISYMKQYKNEINKNLKYDLIFNPLASLKIMSQGQHKNLEIDSLINGYQVNVLNYSLNNNFIKTNYLNEHLDLVNEILKPIEEEDFGKSKFQLDFESNDQGIKSYYELIENIKSVSVVPFWSVYIFNFLMIIGIGIASYFVFRKATYN
ncbi:hypothetical protein [Spiroplasma endosymbiont of Panorpa germanica]|uniref:hypothetical protein n=1 Tax=Spiroplasma endosymbiont of Panorpa germanica TaxID=3066314 RepID=UPI0030D51125